MGLIFLIVEENRIIGPVSLVENNMRSRTALLVLLLPLFVQVLTAGPVLWPIEGSASFIGGIYGTWDFTFTSGPADLHLQQITIDLGPTNVRFDTAPGGFGSLTSLAIGNYLGTDASTGLAEILPGPGAVLDGGQLLTFRFDDFTVGRTFHFTGDVDNPDPTLIPLNDCSGLRPLARAICNLQNVGITAQNDARRAAASLVTAQQFDGARVTYSFGGPGFYASEFTGDFGPAGGLRIFGSASSFANNVQAIPEPATFVSLAIGMLLLGRLRRRRER